MPEEPRDGYVSDVRSRDQLALGAVACLLLSVLAGLLPDSLVPAYYRTAGWIIFALLALAIFYFAFPHMWVYSLWLAGIYGASVGGLLLMILGGERLFARYWAAAGIGALMELVALFLVYTLLMRIRIARSVLESRSPLGLWLSAVLLFFLFSNVAGAGLAMWFSSGSTGALAAYAGAEVFLALATVYICYVPEEAVWAPATTPAGAVAPVAPSEGGPGALLKKMVGKREPEMPRTCPACGAPLKAVRLRCPSCGEAADLSWCAASEAYVAPCPSCGAFTLTTEKRCPKCSAVLPGHTCPACRKVSPVREWSAGG